MVAFAKMGARFWTSLGQVLALSAASILTTPPAHADQWTQREALRQDMVRLRDAGFMMPQESDLMKYPAETIDALSKLMAGQGGDDCTKALSMALFLDAKRPPDAAGMAWHFLSSDLAGELAMIWYKPDEGNVIDALAWGWGSTLWNGVDSLNKAGQSYEAFLEVQRALVDNNQASWVQEIVQHSFDAGWDQAQVEHALGRLDNKLTRGFAAIDQVEAWAPARIELADEALDHDIQRAKEARDSALKQLRGEVGDWAYNDPWNKAVVARKGFINADFVAAKQAALNRRAAKIADVMAARETQVKDALQAIARARIESVALRHYTKTVLDGDCEKLRDEAAPPLDRVADGTCAPGDDACAAGKPAGREEALPPEGGHWALANSLGLVTYKDNNSCYEGAGSVSNGSATFSKSKPRCGEAWPPFNITYAWQAPPPYLVPGAEVALSAHFSGDFSAGWGHGALGIDVATPDTACGGTRLFDVIDHAGANYVGGGYSSQSKDAWSGVLKVPEETYGRSGEIGALELHLRVWLQPVGCYRYVYEWRPE